MNDVVRLTCEVVIDGTKVFSQTMVDAHLYTDPWVREMVQNDLRVSLGKEIAKHLNPPVVAHWE